MRVSFQERVPIVEAVLRRLGRAATVAELYDELKGDHRFENPRRIGAMFRRDQQQPQPVFVREGKDRIALRNPTDAATQMEYVLEESRVYERGQTVGAALFLMAAPAMAAEEGSTLTWEVHDGIARVAVIPKDPVTALRGILKGKGPTFEEILADRNAERERERRLEAGQ